MLTFLQGCLLFYPPPWASDSAEVDADGDGYSGDEDCDDHDATIHPGAEERLDDDVDQDCDGDAPRDQDGDGWRSTLDCIDTDAAINPGAEERCDGLDNDCDGGVDVGAADEADWPVDGDRDGWGSQTDTLPGCVAPDGTTDVTGDCDDGDATVHPGAEEVCDEQDNDCDAETDEGATDAPTWYADDDGDGWGDDEQTMLSCTAPERYSERGGDCDDSQPTSNPDGTEVCDDHDNDCDGLFDSYAVDAPDWYLDADGDGYGAGSSVSTCLAPDGWIGTSGDCDDMRAGTHPGASEQCDGMDQDCDAEVDEDALDAITWYADVDGDGYGDEGVTIEACDAAGVLVGGDCDDGDAGSSPGATETCLDGIDQDCDGADCDAGGDVSVEEIVAVYGDTTYRNFGFYLSGAGDVTGDGTVDVVTQWLDGDPSALILPGPHPATHTYVGDTALAVASGLPCDLDPFVVPNLSSPTVADLVFADDGGLCAGGPGSIWILPGPFDGTEQVSDGTWIIGESASDTFGFMVLPTNDIDDDGVGDFAVSASSNEGSVRVFPAGAADLEEATAVVRGSLADDRIGSRLATGDVDGDGVPDLAIASGDSRAVWVFSGPVVGSISVDDGAALTPAEAGENIGYALAMGDVDADGHADIAVGSPTATATAGRAYLIAGDGLAAGSLADAGTTIEVGPSESFGQELAVVGDLDGDGAMDLLVSAPTSSDEAAGAVGFVYSFSGIGSGTFDADAADLRLTGTSECPLQLTSFNEITDLGDVDGAGASELALAVQGCGGIDGMSFSGAVLFVDLDGPG